MTKTCVNISAAPMSGPDIKLLRQKKKKKSDLTVVRMRNAIRRHNKKSSTKIKLSRDGKPLTKAQLLRIIKKHGIVIRKKKVAK